MCFFWIRLIKWWKSCLSYWISLYYFDYYLGDGVGYDGMVLKWMYDSNVVIYGNGCEIINRSIIVDDVNYDLC